MSTSRVVPYVLAAGGTRLVATNGATNSETVWNSGIRGGATGGGFSRAFARPAWQAAVVPQSGRGVLDVAGNADPNTGSTFWLTESASWLAAPAPQLHWAGLIVLLKQKLNQRLGFINPMLYDIDHRAAPRYQPRQQRCVLRDFRLGPHYRPGHSVGRATAPGFAGSRHAHTRAKEGGGPRRSGASVAKAKLKKRKQPRQESFTNANSPNPKNAKGHVASAWPFC